MDNFGHTAAYAGKDVYVKYMPVWAEVYDQIVNGKRVVDFQRDTGHFDFENLLVYIPFGFREGPISDTYFEYKGDRFAAQLFAVMRISATYRGFPGIMEGYCIFSIEPTALEGELLDKIKKNATKLIKQIEKNQEILPPPYRA